MAMGLAGCTSKGFLGIPWKVTPYSWADEHGIYTYKQAVAEFGEPNLKKTLGNGDIRAEWGAHTRWMPGWPYGYSVPDGSYRILGFRDGVLLWGRSKGSKR